MLPRVLGWPGCRAAVCLLTAILVSGCQGRSVKEDNPVFAAAPPRNSLFNQSADEEEHRISAITGAGSIQPAGFSPAEAVTLSGTSVVADVNGRPVFLDDVIGSFRKMLDADSRLTDVQRQQLLREKLKQRLPDHVDQEIVLQALNAKVPEDRREAIRKSIEPAFQKIVIPDIMKENKLTTPEEVDQLLAKQGSSTKQLQELFVRAQMVNGYVSTLASAPTTIDRSELVKHYQSHIEDYTPKEQVRFAEITVRFSRHGGREGAEKVMTEVVTKLQNGREFSEVAMAHSDSLSADKGGDMGWIERGALTDRDLENSLFALSDGGMTKVMVRDDRFEVYRVIRHTEAKTRPFQDLQKEIEKELIRQKAEESKARVLKELKDKSTVRTILDQA